MRYAGDGVNKPWQGTGHVMNITPSEEISLELRNSRNAPVDQTGGFCVDFVWKSISFDRMQKVRESAYVVCVPFLRAHLTGRFRR